jgi:hypothetical protein
MARADDLMILFSGSLDFSATTQLQMRPLARAIQRQARTPADVSRAMIAEWRRKSATDGHFAASFVYTRFPADGFLAKVRTISLSKSLLLTRSQRVAAQLKWLETGLRANRL